MVNKNEKIFMKYQSSVVKNIPVKEAARLMGKDQQFIRQGIIKGILPIGTAFKKTIVVLNGMKKKNQVNMISI